MLKQRLCLAAIIGHGAFFACEVSAQSNPQLHKLADAYWEAKMERFPTMATALGDYRFNRRLEDVTPQAEQSWRDTLKHILGQVTRLPRGTLSPADVLTRNLLERAITDELLLLDCNRRLMPLDPLDGPHLQLPLIQVSQPFRNLTDYYDYAARLRAFRRQVMQHLANMRAGMARGWISPRSSIQKVAGQIRVHIVSDPKQSALYRPLLTANNLSKTDRENAEWDVAAAIRADVIPAYRRLLVFVEEEYLPRCTKTAGIGSLPGGDEVYRKLVYLHTTVKLTPAEIHQTGLSEVARIRGEMAKIQGEVGFKGPLDDFLVHMRTEPRYRFRSQRELRRTAEDFLQRSRPLMPKLFTRLPNADCEIREIEAFRAAAAPVGYYHPPPQDGSRPGIYYINTYAPNERLRFTLEALTYHEAIPGHHFQIALDQENAKLPKFRRHGSFTAYVEGWALYAEKLGYEIGGYKNPNTRFGQLTFEMWRACRLVVDTGIHAKGWSREQAIGFMTANTSLAIHDIEAEVDRYFSWPGQALAYKTGEMRIVKLRKEAEQQLGDRFDLRAFHDALLSAGAMPIDILEKRMRAWISSQGG